MSTRAQAELVLFIVTLIWSSTFVTIKVGLEYTTPFVFMTFRFIIAALFFAALFYRQLKHIQMSTFRRGVILGFLFGAAITLQTYGLHHTTASKSAFISGTLIIFTPFVQMVNERKFPKFSTIVGIIIVTAGLYLFTSPEGGTLNIGDIATIIAAALLGIYTVYIDIFTKKEESEKIFQLVFFQIVVAVLIGAFSIPLEIPRLEFEPDLLMVIIYLSLGVTIITLFIQTHFQKDTTPTRAVLIFTLEPVVASGFAYYILKEQWSSNAVIGAVLIIFGVLFLELFSVLYKKYRTKTS